MQILKLVKTQRTNSAIKKKTQHRNSFLRANHENKKFIQVIKHIPIL